MTWAMLGVLAALLPVRRRSVALSPTDQVDRLQDLLRLTTENRQLDDSVRRVRAWNDQLLKDKADLLTEVAALAAERERMSLRLDEAAGNLVRAEQDAARVREDLKTEQALAEAHERELRTSLQRIEDLAEKLKAARKTGRR